MSNLMSNHNTAVSRQWASRPDDQRFLSLSDLYDHTLKRSGQSLDRDVTIRGYDVLTTHNNDLQLQVRGFDEPAIFNHWSFGQLASKAKAPAGYLRGLPSDLAAECLNYGLQHTDIEDTKAYVYQNGHVELRAVTSPNYGRIHDHEIVAAVIAMNERDDNRWKVPGVLDWRTLKQNPHVDVTKDNTTLYGSDRDVWMFLVDDINPIKIGTLPNGDDDLVFRGFYVWNSEVGSKTIGLATMYFRGVCANRIIWGVENFKEIKFPHFRSAPERFAAEVVPALHGFSESSTQRVVDGVNNARKMELPNEPDDKVLYAMALGLNRKQAMASLNAVRAEEEREPLNAWDLAMGITAYARRVPNQDTRVELELVAKKLLDRAA